MSDCKSNISLADYFFIIFILSLLIFPTLNIFAPKEKVYEPRETTPYTPLFNQSGKLNLSYGKELTPWFNDIFLGRNYLVKYYNLLNYKINRFPKIKQARVGRDNWIFFTEHHSIEKYQNIAPLTQKDLENITTYLMTYQNWCQAHKKSFYFVVIPDKHRIYDEYLPYINQLKNPSRITQLLNYLHTHTQIKTIDLTETLISHKKPDLLFWKNDTHWNDMGAYLGYKEIYQTLRKDYPDLQETYAQNYQYISHEKGDLSVMFPQTSANTYPETYIQPILKYKNPFPVTNQRFNLRIENPHNRYKLFIQHDSFGKYLIPYFFNTFAEVQTKWPVLPLGLHENIKSMEQADIIIIETVERYLENFNLQGKTAD